MHTCILVESESVWQHVFGLSNKIFLIQIEATKMATTPVKEDAFLASQCLDFCQMLAGKSLSFSFSLKIGTNYFFSLDTRGEAALSSAKKKKKQTPSTLRRNARRREQFLQKKLASPAPVLRPVSEKGTEALQKAPTSLHHHPSPPPSSER